MKPLAKLIRSQIRVPGAVVLLRNRPQSNCYPNIRDLLKLVFSPLVFLILSGALLSACTAAPEPEIAYSPEALRFSGETALAQEIDFVTRFPNRDSGQPNSFRSVEWLQEQFTSYGLSCFTDRWEVINYSRPVPLENVICRLPGASVREILVIAHHDQSPDTIQGADNDGSGIAILLQLAQIFAAEGTPRYTLAFVATDGEEYGMLGTRRYIQTHPYPRQIIAGVSLDNLGKRYYTGLEMSPIGQFRGYGPLWLLRTVQEAARKAGDLWVPPIRSPLDQVLNQAVPVSFMDQGPMVAAGIPALGFAGVPAPEYAEDHWQTYHSPGDTVEVQSAAVLYQSGRTPEALIRQLLAMDSFPEEKGPYLYFAGNGQVLRGLPLWLIFIGFVLVFFLAAFLKGRNGAGRSGWQRALPHFLSLWLPLLASVVLTYLLVATGLMDKYHLYPATAKDEPIFEPRWPAVIIFLLGMGAFFFIGRRLAGRAQQVRGGLPARQESSRLAWLVIGLGALYILAINPFSLLFLVPVLCWLGIGGRRGAGRVLDSLLFLAGGAVVYLLIYFFGFVILRNNLVILWYMLMMFSIGEISFPTAAAITAILGAGLSLLVLPPGASD